ncbi:MAG: hypothetical protein ACOH2K_14390 [Burkholderiaceae bacterium]
MSTSKMNIRFSYLYRDAGNFKNFGEIVFTNPHNLPLEELFAKLKLALLDEMFFDAFAVGVPDRFFDDYDEELDHEWHEFECLEEVDSLPTDQQNRSIEIFISRLTTKKLQ